MVETRFGRVLRFAGLTSAQPTVPVPSLLEQVLEGLARVVVTRRRGGCGGGHLLGIGGGGGVLLDGGAKFVEGAIVFCIFGRNSLGNLLRTLELRAGVEKTALLATVQFHLAFGAFSVGIEAGGENRAAVGTADSSYRADHARGARAELIGARPALRRLAILAVTSARLVFFFVLLRVAIAAMTVLSVHKRLRPSVLTDCQTENRFFALAARTRGAGKAAQNSSRKPQGSADSALRYRLIRIAMALQDDPHSTVACTQSD